MIFLLLQRILYLLNLQLSMHWFVEVLLQVIGNGVMAGWVQPVESVGFSNNDNRSRGGHFYGSREEAGGGYFEAQRNSEARRAYSWRWGEEMLMSWGCCWHVSAGMRTVVWWRGGEAMSWAATLGRERKGFGNCWFLYFACIWISRVGGCDELGNEGNWDTVGFEIFVQVDFDEN